MITDVEIKQGKSMRDTAAKEANTVLGFVLFIYLFYFLFVS